MNVWPAESHDRAWWQEVAYHPCLKYFTWPVMYGRQYLLVEPFVMDRGLAFELKKAAGLCGVIYRKAVDLVLKRHELMLLLGIKPHVVDLVRFACRKGWVGPQPVTVVGRFDFAVKPIEGKWQIKLLEFNADTPSGLVEATEVNGLISELYHLLHPNTGMIKAFRAAFRDFVSYRRERYRRDYHNIVFTSLDWHEEDKGTTLAARDYSGLKARYVPLSGLTVTSDGLYDDRGEKIDLLYRLYPVEWLAEEEEGIKLLTLVAEGKLDLINPLTAFVAQSKVLQAVIWELARSDSPFLSEEEKAIVKTYFLPTYLEPDYLAGQPYVVKPAYEREGNGVSIYDETGRLVAGMGDGEVKESSAEERDNKVDVDPSVIKCGKRSEGTFTGSGEPIYRKMLVYQAYTELPRLGVRTLTGWYEGRLLTGVFLLSGHGEGIFLRVGGEITDNMAYFLPCVLAKGS